MPRRGPCGARGVLVHKTLHKRWCRAVASDARSVRAAAAWARQESFGATVRRLMQSEGYAFMVRGMQRNLVAVAAPIGMTIFLTEALTEMVKERL
jgi:hypothetical protein